MIIHCKNCETEIELNEEITITEKAIIDSSISKTEVSISPELKEFMCSNCKKVYSITKFVKKLDNNRVLNNLVFTEVKV